MEHLKEIIKFRNGLIKYLRKHSNKTEDLNLVDSLIIGSLGKNTEMMGRDFSRMLDIDSAYITRDIIKLEKKELIKRRKVGRRKYICLTPKGNRINRRIRMANSVFLSKLEKKVAPKELEAAYKTIRAANEILAGKERGWPIAANLE